MLVTDMSNFTPGNEVQLTVSAIVPTYRRPDILKRCLEGIAAMTVTPIEILITYRPDADPETAQWLEAQLPSQPRWRLVTVDKPGQVLALNTAKALATGEVIAIFDDDAIPHPDWLKRILGHFADPAVGVAGGRDIVFHKGAPILEPVMQRAGFENFWGSLVGNHHLVVGEPRAVDTVKGCNFAVRRAAMGTLRFDERLLGSGAQLANDSWFCTNLRHHGWTIVLDPQAIVDHYIAQKPDFQLHAWPKRKCHEWAFNHVYTRVYFMGAWKKAKFVLYQFAVGTRYCPGLYFTAHGLLRRPRELPGIMAGGWSGFFSGMRAAHQLRRDPPGRPVTRGAQLPNP